MSTLINLIPHVDYYDNMLSYTMYTTLKGKSNSKGPNDLGNASRASISALLIWTQIHKSGRKRENLVIFPE